MQLGSLESAGSRKQKRRWAEAAELLEQAAEREGQPLIEQYNYACLLALRGETEQALESLRRCLAAGKISVGHVDQDTDWDDLRTNPEFNAILDEFRDPPRKPRRGGGV